MDLPYQPELPIVEPARNVEWTNADKVYKRGLFGRKAIKIVERWDGPYTLNKTIVQASSITNIKDPDLRYALRYKDAVEAVGWVRHSETSSSKGYVTVVATDNGKESELLSAIYSGSEDETFVDWLKVQGGPIAVNENN